VADPLGAQVLWNEIERKVSIKTASKTIELWIDNNTARVNGQSVMIDPDNPNVMPIVIPPGRTMLPLRFIADNLDCNVDWNDLTREVTRRRNQPAGWFFTEEKTRQRWSLPGTIILL